MLIFCMLVKAEQDETRNKNFANGIDKKKYTFGFGIVNIAHVPDIEIYVIA